MDHVGPMAEYRPTNRLLEFESPHMDVPCKNHPDEEPVEKGNHSATWAEMQLHPTQCSCVLPSLVPPKRLFFQSRSAPRKIAVRVW